MKHRIVYLQRSSLDPAVRLRSPDFPHEWIEYPLTPAEQIAERLAGATIAISNAVRLSREAIAAVPGLRMVAIPSTGADSVDLQACRERGIVVSNVRGYARYAVAEHALMLMLALSRNLKGYAELVAQGAWQKSPRFFLGALPVGDLHGATLGIVGLGVLGASTRRLAEAFGMRVLIAERRHAAAVREGYTAFGDVLAQADFLSLHCPLSADTLGLIGEPELRAMRRTAFLVNTARGELIDERALARALREGWIAGAALDVLAEEPPVSGSPLLDALDLRNLIVTPHVAWTSAQAKQRLADELIDNIEAFAHGAPVNRLA